ncbi:TetR/AcrR family transcriptional regulator [Isoptericola sp. NPDC019693]|uniref:TetR/AcrR family transcriptional regulator n=1 Tax=Isoptericola sp. NPDC019693 TaxID=3364009 RepID=UPI0037A22451
MPHTPRVPDHRVPNPRVPAAERRAMLVAAGVEIARAEGGRAVTLARVAEATGVTKPVAYRLFDSLADLLLQMERHVLAGYETVVTGALERAAARGASRAELLGVLAAAYVDHSLGAGEVYDTVSAARTAAEHVDQHVFELPASAPQLAEALGIPPDRRTGTLVAFLGAADNLVAAVQAGVLDRDTAVDHLVALFAPQLPAGGRP